MADLQAEGVRTLTQFRSALKGADTGPVADDDAMRHVNQQLMDRVDTLEALLVRPSTVLACVCVCVCVDVCVCVCMWFCMGCLCACQCRHVFG